jgi:hypothetical protein
MLLVVPLTANRDMGLDEPGVIDQTLAPAQIHVGLEGIKGEVPTPLASRGSPSRAHSTQHRDGGVLRGAAAPGCWRTCGPRRLRRRS